MKTYPVFAVIENRPCLVVGGGAVGERKVQDLLAAGARVTVVSRNLTPALADLASRGKISYLSENFDDTDRTWKAWPWSWPPPTTPRSTRG